MTDESPRRPQIVMGDETKQYIELIMKCKAQIIPTPGNMGLIKEIDEMAAKILTLPRATLKSKAEPEAESEE